MSESSNFRRQSERNRALSLLKQARNVLAERLVQAVLDLGEDLLDDARGDSYAGEIDSLHDQLGTRLGQVNHLLAGLSEASTSDERESSRPAPEIEIPQTWTYKTTDQDIAASTTVRDGTPGRDTDQSISRPTTSSAGTAQSRSTASTYPLFVQDIVRRDLPAAARHLTEILGFDPVQCEACAMRFRDQLDRDPGFLAKVHGLRKALNAGHLERAEVLLAECFGLTGRDAESAMQSLNGWL